MTVGLDPSQLASVALKRRVKVAELRRLNPQLAAVGAAANLCHHLKGTDAALTVGGGG